MSDHHGLENRRSGNVTEGSNPSLSASFCGNSCDNDAAPSASFAPRSTSSDGALVGTPRYIVQPITVKAARAWVKDVHRHLPNVQGGLFASAVHDVRGMVAVGIAGNPAQVWQGTGRIAITRVAALQLPFVKGSDGNLYPAPACTMIYRSLCDAARALGYREAWTYTLPEEDGASLRAAGFTDMGLTAGGEHDRPSRRRSPAVRPEPKRRWMRELRPKRGCSPAPALDMNAKELRYAY